MAALNLKPFYGRRRVRKLCDRIDSLKVMVDRLAMENASLRTAESQHLASLRAAASAVVSQDRGTDEGEARFESALHELWMVLNDDAG